MIKINVLALRRLTQEILTGIKQLERLMREWEAIRCGDWTDSLLRRAASSIFHDFYCGAENIFKRIAPILNGGIPSDSQWQATLLNQMQLEIPEVRPAVIARETYKRLQIFLAFRHDFRYGYTSDFDVKKLEELDRLYPDVQQAVLADLNRLLLFLDKRIGERE